MVAWAGRHWGTKRNIMRLPFALLGIHAQDRGANVALVSVARAMARPVIAAQYRAFPERLLAERAGTRA